MRAADLAEPLAQFLDDAAGPLHIDLAWHFDGGVVAVFVPAQRPAGDARWLAAAAVVTADELVLPDGTHVHLDPAVSHLGQLAELATQLRLGHGGGKYVLPSPAQLLLTTDGMARFGIVLDCEDPASLDPDGAADEGEPIESRGFSPMVERRVISRVPSVPAR